MLKAELRSVKAQRLRKRGSTMDPQHEAHAELVTTLEVVVVLLTHLLEHLETFLHQVLPDDTQEPARINIATATIHTAAA